MWDAVKWTLAGQVAALFPVSEEGLAVLVEDDPPEAFFDALRGAGALDDALWLLAVALPRRVAISWAHRCISASGQLTRLLPRDTVASSAVSAWLSDGSDNARRVAQDAAQQAELGSPEALLAYAVFFSGGSLTPADSPQQVPAPPELAGKLVAAAMLMATTRFGVERSDKAKGDCLDLGAEYAQDVPEPTKHLDPSTWADDVRAHASDAQDRKPKRAPQRPAPHSGP